MERIYLDYAATTYTAPEVLEAMMPYFTEVFGNASSQHGFGREAVKAVDAARDKIASILGCTAQEIYFTSGGSESDNWAIKGIAMQLQNKGKHIITTTIEHPAIYNSCTYLQKKGFEVTFLPVDEQGFISLAQLEAAIRPDTTLISVMTANNEVGTLQPIEEIAKIAHSHGIVFHTDAVQAIGAVDINVKRQGIDMLSLSAHKFYGPKGIGLLYVKKGVRPEKYISGGEQERNMRAGTTATPLIIGLATALELAVKGMAENNAKIQAVRDHFVKRVLAEIPYATYNGAKDPAKRLPNNASLSFRFIEGESILLMLDLDGIAASSGSACSSGNLEPSRVLLSLGISAEESHGTIRFTFGKDNTIEQADFVVERLKAIVSRLREMSPLFYEFNTAKLV